jgi:hypothetical protein
MGTAFWYLALSLGVDDVAVTYDNLYGVGSKIIRKSAKSKVAPQSSLLSKIQMAIKSN